MDTIDIAIVEELEVNSRVPYREIASKLDLSVNAVHKRVQNMISIGSIHSLIARLGMVTERPIIATSFGHSTAADLVTTIEGLGRDEHTSQVVVATGNYIYFQWYLRNLDELDDFLSVARREAKIASPQVVFRTVRPPAGKGEATLSGLDWRLIQSLSDNSRRPVVDLAEELGVSPKTVRRRLTKMESDGSIMYTARFTPNASHDMFCFFHTVIRRDLDRREAVTQLMDKYKDHILDATFLDSDPHLVLLSGWTKTMKELKEVRGGLEQEPSVDTLFVNIYFETYFFDTWREGLVKRRAEEAVRRKGRSA